MTHKLLRLVSTTRGASVQWGLHLHQSTYNTQYTGGPPRRVEQGKGGGRGNSNNRDNTASNSNTKQKTVDSRQFLAWLLPFRFAVLALSYKRSSWKIVFLSFAPPQDPFFHNWKFGSRTGRFGACKMQRLRRVCRFYCFTIEYSVFTGYGYSVHAGIWCSD